MCVCIYFSIFFIFLHRWSRGADHRKGLPVGHSLGAADSRGTCAEHHLSSSLRGLWGEKMSGNGMSDWIKHFGDSWGPNWCYCCRTLEWMNFSFWSQRLFPLESEATATCLPWGEVWLQHNQCEESQCQWHPVEWRPSFKCHIARWWLAVCFLKILLPATVVIF